MAEPDVGTWRSSVSELIWINGKVIPIGDARISVEDRGYQFADGVYEVVRIYNTKPFALGAHLGRLWTSAEGVKISIPYEQGALEQEIRAFITRCGLRESSLYLQVTRGVAPRNHRFPANTPPVLLFYVRELPDAPVPGEGEGVKLLAVEDERWKRCWIKSIALLANVLAKHEAVSRGYDEAVFVNGEVVTECATSNVFAVASGRLITHPIGAKVLPGITRGIVIDCAQRLGIPVEERPLREEEVRRADELFITSTTREVCWVARWNERYIGQGKCGPTTIKLHRAYRDRVRVETQGK